MEGWSLLSKEWLEGTKGAGRQGKGDVEVTRWRDGHGWSREVAVEMGKWRQVQNAFYTWVSERRKISPYTAFFVLINNQILTKPLLS